MADPSGNGWNEWKIHVLNELKKFSKLEEILMEHIIDFQTFKATLIERDKQRNIRLGILFSVLTIFLNVLFELAR